MAGKDKRGRGDVEIDDFGFDPYDPFSPDIEDRNQTPVQKALKGLKTGVKETALTKDTLSRLVKAAVPSGISNTMDTVEDIIGTGSELYNSVSQQILPEIVNLKRNVRKLMPRVRDKLPNPLAKAIDSLVADRGGASTSFNYDPDEESIKGALRDVFEAERMERDFHRAEDETKQAIRDKANEKRADFSSRTLVAIRNSLQQMANHQDQVSTRRDQKLLELQYRQYFTQRDLLIETKRANVDVLGQLKAIVENSSLPDLAKLKAYNARQERPLGIKERADDFIRNFRGKLNDRLQANAKRFGSRLRMGLMMGNAGLQGASMGAGMGGPSWQESAGEFAGQELTGGLAGALGGRLARYVRKIPGVGAANERLNFFNDNAPELLSDWAKKRSNGIRWDFWRKRNPFDFSQGFGANAINSLKTMIPKFYEGTPEFTAKGYGANREPVSFDSLTRKSIVEIIPGLLSKLLQSSEGIRTGRSVDALQYDHATGGFKSSSDFKTGIRNQLLPKDQTEYLGKRVDALMKTLTRGSKLSDGAKDGLRRQLIHNMVIGRRFNASQYANGRNLDQVTDPSVLRELTSHFAARFPTDENGNVRTDVRTQRRLNRYSGQYQEARRLIPNFDDSINNMLDAGNREHLRSIGALKMDGRRELLDPQFIVNAVLGTGSQNDENKESGEGSKGGSDTGRRRSRTRRRRGMDDRAGGVPPTDDTSDSQGQGSRGSRGATQDQLNDVLDRLNGLSRSIQDQATGAAERAANALRGSGANDQHVDLDEMVEDVYVPGEREPRLTRTGIRAGKYICETTNKVIKSLDDIKGPVMDTAGNVVLSTADVLAGIATGTGVRLAQISKRAEKWVNRADFATRLIGGRVSNVVDKFAQGLFGLRGKIDDVYVLGMPEPVLTGAKMRQGQYFDKYTKKPINTIDDIKGAVVDINGDVVLTDEDYDKGMYLKDGTLIRRSGLIYNLGRFTNWYFGGYYRNLWKGLKKLGRGAKKLAGTATRLALGVPDVYTVDDLENPKLLARLLRRGMYLSSKTGKRIYRLGQIDSDVLGPDGNIALTMDDVNRGLCNKYGEPLKALLPRALNKAIDIAGAPTRMMSRLWTKSMRGMGRAANFGLAKGADAAGWAFDKLTGFRKGSWEERRFRREEDARNKHEEKKEKKDKKEGKGWFGALMMIGGILKGGVDAVLKKLNPLRYLKDILMATRAGGMLGDMLGGGKKGLLRKGGRLLGTGARALGRGAVGVGARIAATGVGSALLSGAGTVAGAVGTTLAAGASAVGAGLAAAGSAALAVLTSPVTLTVGAVVGAGFLAWWLWKKFGASPDPIQAARLAEYGIPSNNRDLRAKVLKLEESMADYTRVNGTTAMFSKELPMKDIYQLFEVDTSSNDNIIEFHNWLLYRFRPIYLKFAAKGHELQSGIKVHELDDKLADGDKPRLVRETRFSDTDPNYPYNKADGPNPPAKAVTGTEEIDAAIQNVCQKYAKAEREKNARDTVKQRRAENAAQAEGLSNPLAKKIDQNTPDKRYNTESGLEKVKADTIAKHGDVGTALWDAGSSRKIDELAGIRLRTYGLTELDKGRVDALLLMEGDLIKQLTYQGDGTAFLNYSANDLFELYAPRFQVSITDRDRRSDWKTWLDKRFLPAMLAFATAVRRCDKAVSPTEAWKLLKPEDQLKVGQSIVAATTMSWFSKVSVWTIKESPWDHYELNTDSASTKPALESLMAAIKQRKLDEQRKSLRDPGTGNGLQTEQQRKAANDPNYKGNAPSNIALGGGVQPPSGSGTDPDASTNGGGYGSGGGGNYGNPSEFTDGTGGQYQQLPDSKGDGWENNKDLIVAASKMAGVDAGTMATFGAIESDFRPKVGAGTSSASGLYQFIKSTWDTMLKKYGAKYGIPLNTPPTDPKANALMGAEFLRENRDGLSKFLGREPTDVDLYAAHFMGLGGARKFFGMQGNAIAAQVMPAAAKANESIFYAQGGRARTRDEVMEELMRRVNTKGRAFAGAAYALSSGLTDGKAQVDPVSQSAANDDNVVAAANGDMASLANQQQGKGGSPIPDTSGKGGYMGDASPAMATPPVTPNANPLAPTPAAPPDLGPAAQQALGTQEADARRDQQIAARAKQVDVVTNKDICDVLQKQLTTQIETRDLVQQLLEIAQNRQGSNDSSASAAPNDKSTAVNRQSNGGSTRGPVSLKHTGT